MTIFALKNWLLHCEPAQVRLSLFFYENIFAIFAEISTINHSIIHSYKANAIVGEFC